jgi:hypothetical protein
MANLMQSFLICNINFHTFSLFLSCCFSVIHLYPSLCVKIEHLHITEMTKVTSEVTPMIMVPTLEVYLENKTQCLTSEHACNKSMGLNFWFYFYNN